jgi:hypothetical protein
VTTNPFDADRPPEPERRGGRRRGGGRRRDESVMVPDVRFDSYYGRSVIKPAPWEADIPAYVFLGGVAAGSGLIGAGAHARGLPLLRRNSRYAALAAVAAGGLALVHDLGRPSRALNMVRTLKVTSPMSVGSWILTGFGAFAGLASASELGRSLLPAGSRLARLLRAADPVASAGSAVFAPPLAAYTAVLLADTATPTWHESYRELPFVFVGSANAAAAGLAMVTSPPSQTRPARRLAVVGAALELTAMHRLESRLDGLVGEPLREGRPGALLRASKALTAGGAVGATLLGRWRLGGAVSGLALLAGSVCTRFGVFEAGITSTKDPRYTVTPQRERLEARRDRGVTGDSITTSRP